MKIGILTGGGDCPGLNQAIRGAVYRGLDFQDDLVGIQDGWKGMLTGDAKPLGLAEVEELSNVGGTILGTSRTNPTKKEEDLKKVFHTFHHLQLDALIAMGGEDTLGVAALLSQKGLPCVGVPKTMDNDLSATDFTFGFDTSVTVAVEAAERLKDTGKSHRRIMVLEVMGRHAGWVALYTGLGAGADWTLIPEQAVDLTSMCEHLKKVYARKRYALVVVSEGITLPAAPGEKTEEALDAFGHMILKKRGVGETIAQKIEEATKVETRVSVIGHMQRGGPPTLFDRILGFRTGVKAVEMVHERKFGQMACLRGNEVLNVPLTEATGTLKTVPENWWRFANIFFK